MEGEPCVNDAVVVCQGKQYECAYRHCHAHMYGVHVPTANLGWKQYNSDAIFSEPSTEGNCTHGEIRLVGGVSELEGRVEICVNNVWGTICDTGFSSETAKLICRSAGKPTEGTTHTSWVTLILQVCVSLT